MNEKDESIQVSTLLTVIGVTARRAFATFKFDPVEVENKIIPVLAKFEPYCRRRLNIPFERNKFYRHQQQAGESLDQYATALKELDDRCNLTNTMPDEILPDRILFGISDGCARETLLHKDGITLAKVIDTCRAAGLSQSQMREIDGNPNLTESVNVVRINKIGTTKLKSKGKWEPIQAGECHFCGNAHEFKKELCPAYGKRCNKYGKDNHFAKRCQQKSSQQKKVNTIEEPSEGDVYILHEVSLIQSGADRFVTLRLRMLGNFMTFLLDTGAECIVVPLKLYKEATGDVLLQNVIPSIESIVGFGGYKMRLAG